MDQKRLFLAIAISVAILLGFQLLVAPHLPNPPPPPPAQVANSATRRQRRVATPAAGPPGAGGQPPRPTAPKNVPRVKIAAPRLSGSISLLGARLDDLVLNDYRETLAPEFAARAAAGAAVGQRSRTTCSTAGAPRPGEQVKLPGNDTVWTASADTLGAGQAGDAVLGQRRRA